MQNKQIRAPGLIISPWSVRPALATTTSAQRSTVIGRVQAGSQGYRSRETGLGVSVTDGDLYMRGSLWWSCANGLAARRVGNSADGSDVSIV